MIPLRSSERLHSRTPVITALIALNIMVFLYQWTLGGYGDEHFVRVFGVVPARLNPISLVSYMFLHGSVLHIGGNMLFLWVYGRNVEDLIGSTQFLLFYLISGIVAALVQVVASLGSTAPLIGASGAIAGVMGAYLVKFPRSTIDTVIWLLFVIRLAIPAPLLLIYWFLIQFYELNRANSYMTGAGGVAYLAHIGGFIAGILLIFLFPARQRWRSWYDDSV